MEKFYAKKQHITLVGLFIHFLNHSGSHEQNELKEGKKGFKMTQEASTVIQMKNDGGLNQGGAAETKKVDNFKVYLRDKTVGLGD